MDPLTRLTPATADVLAVLLASPEPVWGLRIAHDAEHHLVHAVPKLTTALIHAYPAR